MVERFDKIIIGAGLYGLYSALFCGERGESVLVIECDATPFRRATYINQARVHQGYHYPRSLSTALKSANYFERFNRDFGFCIWYDLLCYVSPNWIWEYTTRRFKFEASDLYYKTEEEMLAGLKGIPREAVENIDFLVL